MKVLTPAALTPHGGSLRLLRLAFRTSRSQPREGSERRFRSRINAPGGSRDPGFAKHEEARHTIPPKRIRHPAGCSFASGCSPPRIAATQLPSASCATTSHETDSHPPDKATSQTHSWPGLSRPSTSLGRQYFRILSWLRQASRQDSGKALPFLKLDHVDGRDKPGHDGADRFG